MDSRDILKEISQLKDDVLKLRKSIAKLSPAAYDECNNKISQLNTKLTSCSNLISTCKSNIDAHSISLEKLESGVSNPNILINDFFKINQRGESTYSTRDSYTVDHWKLIRGTLTVVDDGITLTGNGEIWQPIEEGIVDDLYCFSIVLNGVKSGAISVIYANLERQTVASGDGYIAEIVKENSIYWLSIFIYDDSKITSVKLEKGKCISNHIQRSYNDDLDLCKRYYQVIYIQGYSVAASLTNYIYPYIKTNVDFRTIPVIDKIKAQISIRGQGSMQNATSTVVHQLINGGVVLKLGGSFTFREVYGFANGEINLSAEF